MASLSISSPETMAFDRYDAEFESLSRQIQQSLETEPPGQYTEHLLQQCDDLMKQMSLEARSVQNVNLKRDLLAKVRTCKGQYQALQQQYDRGSLLLSSNNTANNKSQQDRLLLQKNEDLLHSQNDTLERARKTMQETETIALEITEELGQNREKLLTTQGRIREMSGLTGRAKRILNSMNQRAVQQKVSMYAVGIGLLFAFLFIVWSSWG